MRPVSPPGPPPGGGRPLNRAPCPPGWRGRGGRRRGAASAGGPLPVAEEGPWVFILLLGEGILWKGIIIFYFHLPEAFVSVGKPAPGLARAASPRLATASMEERSGRFKTLRVSHNFISPRLVLLVSAAAAGCSGIEAGAVSSLRHSVNQNKFPIFEQGFFREYQHDFFKKIT